MQIQPMRSQLPSLIYARRKPHDWESREQRKYESRSRAATWRGELRERGPSRTSGSGVAGAPPSTRRALAWSGEFCGGAGIAGENRGAKTNRPNVGGHHPVTRARPGLHDWSDTGPDQLARRIAFAAAVFSNKSWRSSDLSRTGPVNGLSDYRPA